MIHERLIVKTMFPFTVLECLFRSELRVLFLGFLQVFELEYMFLELLFIRFVVDVWFILSGSMCFMLMLRFSVDLWKLFTEPVRFMFVLNIT